MGRTLLSYLAVHNHSYVANLQRRHQHNEKAAHKFIKTVAGSPAARLEHVEHLPVAGGEVGRVTRRLDGVRAVEVARGELLVQFHEVALNAATQVLDVAEKELDTGVQFRLGEGVLACFACGRFRAPLGTD